MDDGQDCVAAAILKRRCSREFGNGLCFCIRDWSHGGHRPSISGEREREREPPLFRVVSINPLLHGNALRRSSALASTVDMFVCIPFCCESGPHSSFLDQSCANRKPLEIRIRRFLIVGKSISMYWRLESAFGVSSRACHLCAQPIWRHQIPPFMGSSSAKPRTCRHFPKIHIKAVATHKAV